jgi:NADPH-dependent glutamate synthase beta subunit-like oxidoreductase
VDLKNTIELTSNIVITERVSNYNEFTIPLAKDKIKEQGSRCMDCGIPFCHSACPLGNLLTLMIWYIKRNGKAP